MTHCPPCWQEQVDSFSAAFVVVVIVVVAVLGFIAVVGVIVVVRVSVVRATIFSDGEATCRQLVGNGFNTGHLFCLSL